MPTSNDNEENVGARLAKIVLDILILNLQILYFIILSIISLIAPKQPKSVRGEIVLVTGAGHGIGKELAILYASEGATVVVWDINKETGAQTVEEIARFGYPEAHYFKCDVSNYEDVVNAAKEVQTKVGDVTILINNAGILTSLPLLDLDKNQIERILNINVLAHFWTLKAFLPVMKKRNRGHIVALSSCAGLIGFANCLPYCCSKFAVRGLMEALREELRTNKSNAINVTCIYPYVVDTGLCKNPIIKFKSIMPMIEPKAAALEIMDAQRRDVFERSIPRHIFWLERIGRVVLPLRAQLGLMDFLGNGLAPDK